MERKELTDIILQSVSHADSAASKQDGKCVQKYMQSRGYLERLFNRGMDSSSKRARNYLQSIGSYYSHESNDNNFGCRRDLHQIKDYLVYTISSEIDYGSHNGLRRQLRWLRPLYIVPLLTIAAYFTPFPFGSIAELVAVGMLVPIGCLEAANFKLQRASKKEGKADNAEQDEKRKKLVLLRKAIKSVPISEFGEVLKANKPAIRPYITLK